MEKLIEEQRKEIERLRKEIEELKREKDKSGNNKAVHTITLILSLTALIMDLLTILRLVKVNSSIK
jgi:hypothetical protein